MMTREHFEAVAKILRETSVDTEPGNAPVELTEHEQGRVFQTDVITLALAQYFANENPRFDSARFLEASKW